MLQIAPESVSLSSQVWETGWGVQKEHWNPKECPFQGSASPKVPYRGEDSQHPQVRHDLIMDIIMYNVLF